MHYSSQFLEFINDSPIPQRLQLRYAMFILVNIVASSDNICYKLSWMAPLNTDTADAINPGPDCIASLRSLYTSGAVRDLQHLNRTDRVKPDPS